MIFKTLPSSSIIAASYVIAISLVSCASPKELYHTVDIVEAKSTNEAAVMYFYENNWKIFRERAYQDKHIQGYQLMKSPEDSVGAFKLVLLTAYDSLQLSESELNFQKIIQELRPDGPALLNGQPIREHINLIQSLDTKTIVNKR